MRRLLAADLHYSLPQFDWVREVEAISMSPFSLATTWTWPRLLIFERKARSSRITSAGNHDLDARNQTGEKVSRWILDARGYGVPSDGDSLLISSPIMARCAFCPANCSFKSAI
jgi:hypothetical protein